MSPNKSRVKVEINNLKKYFPIKKGFFRKAVGHLKAVNDVSLRIKERETLGLVGESGCGKSTLGRTIVKLYAPTDGEVLFHNNGNSISVYDLGKKEMKKVRQNMQMIFQDPFSSLNERMTVMDNIIEPLVCNNIGNKTERGDRAASLLKQVGLREGYLKRYPHSLSGGQRQRVGIARALSIKPKFVVADEPVSGLDVSVQAQILNLLKELQTEYKLTILFISHDLGVIRYIANRIAVMYTGKIVEIAKREKLLNSPKHPYTEALLSSVPKLGSKKNRIILEGTPPDPVELPEGCIFNSRCLYSQDICYNESPELIKQKGEHFAACHFSDSLDLRGIN